MYYQIKKDEKIADVINFFDIPFELIQGYNPFVKDMDGDYQNKVLSLPTTYMVQPGETYESIHKKFSLSLKDFSLINSHLGDQAVIYPGQTVFIPPFTYRLNLNRGEDEANYLVHPIYREE